MTLASAAAVVVSRISLLSIQSPQCCFRRADELRHWVVYIRVSTAILWRRD